MSPAGAAPQINIRFAEDGDAPAIERFNQRLDAGGAIFRMSLRAPLPGEHHSPEGHFVRREQLLVVEGDEVRGGVLLQHHRIAIRGVEQPFCWLQLPISEALVDRTYSSAFMPLLKNALRHQPVAMGLGVGGFDATWSQIMMRTRWRHAAVPFFFFPLHGGRFARELRYLQASSKRKIPAQIAAATGLASLAGIGWSSLRRLRLGSRTWTPSVETDFGPWADEVYHRAKSQYGALVSREASALRTVFPPEDQRYTRIRIRARNSNKELGWIMIVHKQMEDDKYFGNLHVGTLVNGCAELSDVPAILAAGFEHLADLGVDLVVANWSHQTWRAAVKSQGFFSGPSNFAYFVSPKAVPVLEDECPLAECHMTRGDCDTPASLMPRE